jgi:DNA-binding transcriptional LysR family regulator
VELRQLRYFVSLAEELHFGRAAAREHIVQSALSQQLKRLERELGVALLQRTTHYVRLTPAGRILLVEARQILAHVDRAAIAAQRAAPPAPVLRVGTVDASYDSMPQILRRLGERHAALEVHQVEAGLPDQFRRLVDGRLDVGLGYAFLAPPEVSYELIRLDRLGVLLCPGHDFAGARAVPVAALATQPLLLPAAEWAPEFNQLVIDLCRSVGFAPTAFPGTVHSIRSAVDLIGQRRCLACVPESAVAALPELTWRPLIEPAVDYPWSVLWRSADESEYVTAFRTCARDLAGERHWLQRPVQLVA